MSIQSLRNLGDRSTATRVPYLGAVAFGFFVLGCSLLYLASPLSRASHVERNVGPATHKIEDIPVGQRVWADNPDVETTRATGVDPATWKRLRLRAESVWDDGTLDDINIVTLQSPQWIDGHKVRVGATVPIPLDLVEMGLPADMRAKVLAIERCPAIDGGAGRVVLTTVNHLNRDAYEITVVDYVNHWSDRAATPAKQIVAWLGVGVGLIAYNQLRRKKDDEDENENDHGSPKRQRVNAFNRASHGPRDDGDRITIFGPGGGTWYRIRYRIVDIHNEIM